jgi:hypothetical protein
MRKSIFALTVAAVVALPAGLTAQGFGIAARGGTLGVGGEAALALGSSAVIRGGIGLMPLELDASISGVDFILTLPETWYNVGLDLYLGPSFRIGGGMLFKPDDPTLAGNFTTTQSIGGRNFTPEEIGTLTGVIDSKDQAPYFLIGFGKHTSSGIGLTLDIGAAFLGDPSVSLDATGGTFSDQDELTSRLNIEAAELEQDIGTYLNYWPIINLGLRIGIGG